MLKRSQLQENDILFSIAGALWRVAIVPSDILPANTNQAIAIIRLNPNKCDINFIKIILSSKFIIEQIDECKKGNAQLNLSLDQVSNFMIPYPDEQTQIKIAKVFNELNQDILGLEKEIEKLQNLKDGLYRMFFIDLLNENQNDC